MELLNGITGFYIDTKDEPPATSLKQFKIHSYEAARTYWNVTIQTFIPIFFLAF